MTIIINIICTFLLLPWGGIVIMSPMMVASHGFKDNKGSILAAILIITYPVLIFSALKIAGLSFWGMNVGGWLFWSAIVCGSIVSLYGLPFMLLNLRRGIPNSGYFIGEKSVYLNGSKISGADPGTFVVLEEASFYSKDAFSVFYYGKKMEGADPGSFKPVNPGENHPAGKDSPVFWKDRQFVYYRDKKVEKADSENFCHIAGLYGKDSRYIYYENRILEGAIPDKFHFLSEGIASDGERLYVYHKRSQAKIDFETFQVVETENERFCRDRNSVYVLYYDESDPIVVVDGADPETFTILERGYAIDKNYVYYYGFNRKNKRKPVRLEGANPVTFSTGYIEEENAEARDGKYKYLYGELVK